MCKAGSCSLIMSIPFTYKKQSTNIISRISSLTLRICANDQKNVMTTSQEAATLGRGIAVALAIVNTKLEDLTQNASVKRHKNPRTSWQRRLQSKSCRRDGRLASARGKEKGHQTVRTAQKKQGHNKSAPDSGICVSESPPRDNHSLLKSAGLASPVLGNA